MRNLQNNSVKNFKIHKHTPLKKLMKVYCERMVCINYILF
ncbi:MAG: hypothetical protein ACRYE7_01020 [Janthinobacterium lividum]